MSNIIKIETMLDGEDPLIDGKYIYSLYLDGLCIYVGQTMDLRSRVYAHLSTRKAFNSVTYFISGSDEANQAEADEIVRKQPTLNEKLPPTSNYILVNNLTKDLLKMLNDSSSDLSFSYECMAKEKLKRYISHSKKIEIQEAIIKILSEDVRNDD